MKKKRLAFVDYWSHQSTRSGDFLCRDPFDPGSIKMGVVSSGGKYDRGRFYSFGTHEAMSIVYFYQKRTGLSYREAFDALSKIANIKQ